MEYDITYMSTNLINSDCNLYLLHLDILHDLSVKSHILSELSIYFNSNSLPNEIRFRRILNKQLRNTK